MLIKFCTILCFLSLILSLVAKEVNAAPSPCSHRYSKYHIYNFTPSGVPHSWKKALKNWGIKKQWGLKKNAAFIPLNAEQEKHLVMRVFFPKGSVNPSSKHSPRGGAGFYANAHIPPTTTRACFRYRVFFPKDFAFARGGKLPGLYGGKAAFGCRKDSELTGFSTRYMWRKEGKGTLYLYSPDKQEDCGELVGLGEWKFERGEWHIMEQEVVLNSMGNKDGIIRVWVNGKNVINKTEAILRNVPDIYINGIMFNSFFGGHDPSWASPKNQFLLFDGFKIYL